MARTPSTMLALGTAAPDFCLEEPASRRRICRDDFREAPALLVVFLCNHCPYVRHIRSGLAAFAGEYMPRGLAMVGVNSNDVTAYPDDAPERMVAEVLEAGYVFPYLFDPTQGVAKAYQAACTPDFFLFDRERRLVYRGQFDDARPGNGIPVSGKDLRAAVDAVLSGRPVSPEQRPSLGCSIKWRPGNAPDYAA